MKLILIIGGLHSLFFAVFHGFFWKKLNWKVQLQKISTTNRAIMEILNLRLIFLFAFHAAICFGFPSEMLYSTLGKIGVLGAALFWLGRSIEQYIYRNSLALKPTIIAILWVLFVGGTVLYAVLFGLQIGWNLN